MNLFSPLSSQGLGIGVERCHPLIDLWLVTWQPAPPLGGVQSLSINKTPIWPSWLWSLSRNCWWRPTMPEKSILVLWVAKHIFLITHIIESKFRWKKTFVNSGLSKPSKAQRILMKLFPKGHNPKKSLPLSPGFGEYRQGPFLSMTEREAARNGTQGAIQFWGIVIVRSPDGVQAQSRSDTFFSYVMWTQSLFPGVWQHSSWWMVPDEDLPSWVEESLWRCLPNKQNL